MMYKNKKFVTMCRVDQIRCAKCIYPLCASNLVHSVHKFNDKKITLISSQDIIYHLFQTGS